MKRVYIDVEMLVEDDCDTDYLASAVEGGLDLLCEGDSLAGVTEYGADLRMVKDEND